MKLLSCLLLGKVIPESLTSEKDSCNIVQLLEMILSYLSVTKSNMKKMNNDDDDGSSNSNDDSGSSPWRRSDDARYDNTMTTTTTTTNTTTSTIDAIIFV